MRNRWTDVQVKW